MKTPVSGSLGRVGNPRFFWGGPASASSGTTGWPASNTGSQARPRPAESGATGLAQRSVCAPALQVLGCTLGLVSCSESPRANTNYFSFFHSCSFFFSLKTVFTSFPSLQSPVVRICTRQHRCSSVMRLWKEVPERENEEKLSKEGGRNGEKQEEKRYGEVNAMWCGVGLLSVKISNHC